MKIAIPMNAIVLSPSLSQHSQTYSEPHVTARYNLANGEYQLIPYYILES